MKTRRLTVILTAIITIALLLSGCGAAASSPTTAGETVSASKELNLFNWTEYMPDSVLAAFEKETGIKVTYSTYSSNEEMLAKIQSGEKGMYDIAVASDYMVSTMIAEGLLQKLDAGKIPNSANIDATYLKKGFDANNEYSLPYMLSPAILCYNEAMYPAGIKSYKDLLNKDLSGSLVMLDDQRMIIGMAELANGFSVNTVDAAELKTTTDWLNSLKPNIKLFDSDSPKSAMISGETAAGYMWCAEVALSMAENPDIKAVYPEEGTVMMIDNFVIPAGAKNSENAMKFIDFVLRPEISIMISAEFPYVNPNKAAQPLLPDSFKNNLASNPPVSELEKGKLLESLNENAKLYDDLWTTFKNQ